VSQESIVLVGAGGHARACIDVIEREGYFVVKGLVGLPREVGSRILGYPVEKAMADGIKRPSASELKNKSVARKSLVAACAILNGEVFSETNLIVKRPRTGLSPMHWYEELGRKARRGFDADELIEL
jgi:N,N'-diacetyllegionaminate synthase